MSLHAQNVAFAAGAVGEEVGVVARRILEAKANNEEAVGSVLAELRAR